MIHLGDCIDWLRSLPDASVDSIVTDPPYGLGFMGKAWDALPPGIDWARECLRVLKPGGHIVAFGGTRTVHRLAVALEDAGFEIRDTIGWVYYSGFPKSLDVSKAIDAAAGAEREVLSEWRTGFSGTPGGVGALSGLDTEDVRRITAPATPEAQRWSGFGTSLKPSIEPAILARKPLTSTVAANVLEHGTGALNIDGCRFAPGDESWVGPSDGDGWEVHGHAGQWVVGGREGREMPMRQGSPLGRWPANLYYCPKAPRTERERGCDGLPERTGAAAVEREEGSAGKANPRAGAGETASKVRNNHPTVKPVRLMRWLTRLVTPPGGLTIDPFTGSGSTGVAAVLEGFRFAGAEREPDYHAIAASRIAHAERWPASWADTAPGFVGEASDEIEALERLGQVSLFGGAK